MFGLSIEQLRAMNAEIIVTFNGIDTTLSQTVYSKFSYTTDEILVDYDFVDVVNRNKDGTLSLMLEKFHLVKPHLG